MRGGREEATDATCGTTGLTLPGVSGQGQEGRLDPDRKRKGKQGLGSPHHPAALRRQGQRCVTAHTGPRTGSSRSRTSGSQLQPCTGEGARRPAGTSAGAARPSRLGPGHRGPAHSHCLFPLERQTQDGQQPSSQGPHRQRSRDGHLDPTSVATSWLQISFIYSVSLTGKCWDCAPGWLGLRCLQGGDGPCSGLVCVLGACVRSTRSTHSCSR